MNKLVKISDLFTIKYGNSFELINLEQCKSDEFGAVPFVSRTEKNNGISAFVYEVPNAETNTAHTLSVAVSGSVLSTFYQPVSYYTGFHVFVLIPKQKYSVVEMLFYAKYISSNKYRYNYGRQANKTLRDIMIPEKPDENLKEKLLIYQNYINQYLNTKSLSNKKIIINQSDWATFSLSELFTIKGTKTTPILELEEYGKGKYPYVTTQSTNNGIENFYDFYSENGGVLTIDSAVLGYCSYQALNFSASDHVEKLIPKFPTNKYIALFLVTILKLEQYRYNYGRKCSQSRMKERSIKLPVKNGQPDWQFMEDYIKGLPYSKWLQ
jgi:hypothetical protein